MESPISFRMIWWCLSPEYRRTHKKAIGKENGRILSKFWIIVWFSWNSRFRFHLEWIQGRTNWEEFFENKMQTYFYLYVWRAFPQMDLGGHLFALLISIFLKLLKLVIRETVSIQQKKCHQIYIVKILFANKESGDKVIEIINAIDSVRLY